MSRSRPTIDVSFHLIEPGPSNDTGAVAIDWPALFGNDRPVELEVGSGKGLFLANAAMANPGHNFFGVELARKYARLAAERLAKLGISNAKVWPGDARDVLAHRVPDASLHAVHVYFPDPWWKKRHKKRRVFTETLVAPDRTGDRAGGRAPRRKRRGGLLHDNPRSSLQLVLDFANGQFPNSRPPSMSSII